MKNRTLKTGPSESDQSVKDTDGLEYDERNFEFYERLLKYLIHRSFKKDTICEQALVDEFIYILKDFFHVQNQYEFNQYMEGVIDTFKHELLMSNYWHMMLGTVMVLSDIYSGLKFQSDDEHLNESLRNDGVLLTRSIVRHMIEVSSPAMIAVVGMNESVVVDVQNYEAHYREASKELIHFCWSKLEPYGVSEFMN